MRVRAMADLVWNRKNISLSTLDMFRFKFTQFSSTPPAREIYTCVCVWLCAVRCGAVWCGVWCGVVWCGVVWYESLVQRTKTRRLPEPSPCIMDIGLNAVPALALDSRVHAKHQK